MAVASAAYLAVGQVFSLLHELVAYAAVLIRLELHARDQLFDRASILLFYFFQTFEITFRRSLPAPGLP